MVEVKFCERCHIQISDVNDDNVDYFHHIRVMYCDTCRAIVRREQTAKANRHYREKKRYQRDIDVVRHWALLELHGEKLDTAKELSEQIDIERQRREKVMKAGMPT